MKVFFCLLSSIFINLVFGQDCAKFQTGIFENESNFGKSIIERRGSYQLERTVDYETAYLQRIEKKSDCEYILTRYKVISLGNLPEPNMSEKIKVKIQKVEENNFFYTAQLVGTSFTINGSFIKVADEISDDFKKILAAEP